MRRDGLPMAGKSGSGGVQFDKPAEYCSPGTAENTAGLGPVPPRTCRGAEMPPETDRADPADHRLSLPEVCGRRIRQAAVNFLLRCPADQCVCWTAPAIPAGVRNYLYQ